MDWLRGQPSPIAASDVLLVPTVTEVEWKIKPLLEEWAEVASFDAPGVGAEPMTEPTIEAIVARGLAEIDRRGWDRCVVVGDEVGAAQAARIAAAAPRRGAGAGHGPPRARLQRAAAGARRSTPRSATCSSRLGRTDYRSYVRALTQVTQNAYDEELADAYMARVSQEVTTSYVQEFFGARRADRPPPRSCAASTPRCSWSSTPGCLMWTREGFEDAMAALPTAVRTSVDQKPSVSPAFAALVRDFCAGLPDDD